MIGVIGTKVIYSFHKSMSVQLADKVICTKKHLRAKMIFGISLDLKMSKTRQFKKQLHLIINPSSKSQSRFSRLKHLFLLKLVHTIKICVRITSGF